MRHCVWKIIYIAHFTHTMILLLGTTWHVVCIIFLYVCGATHSDGEVDWRVSAIANESRDPPSWNGNIFRVTGPLCGEFTGLRWIPLTNWRPVTRSFDILFDPRLNKRLSKQSWAWWFETPWCSLWHNCNGGSARLTTLRLLHDPITAT